MSQLELEKQVHETSLETGIDPGEKLDVLLPVLGSSGDLNPMLELGIALWQRGHQVTVITNGLFEQQVRKAGLGFVELGTVEEAKAIFADPRLLHPRKSYECVAERVIIPYIEPLYEIIRERQRPNTIIAASGWCFGARIAQEKLKVHLATIHLQPFMLRTLADGGLVGRIRMDASVPRLFKRTFYWLVDKFLFDRSLAPPVNSFRASLGLSPIKRIMKDYVHSPEAVIGLFPEWFAPFQPDWPSSTHLPGFLLYDEGEAQRLTDDADEFLASGPPPVVFTPGSSAATLNDFFRESVDACRIGGFRAMLVTNFPEQLPADLPVGVRAFPYLPFGRILPRCSALVYAGGIATMAQAIKVGIPQLVVPHVNDQPDNALRIERLGLGLRIDPKHYKAARVARELNQLLSSEQIRARCSVYAQRMDPTAALNRTCDLIASLTSKCAFSEPSRAPSGEQVIASACG
jgi:rhamnosyltransferase subunit B